MKKLKFDPSKLNHDNPDKAKITEALIKMLKKMSNANLVKNADRLLSKRAADNDNEWIGPEKKRFPENRYKMSY